MAVDPEFIKYLASIISNDPKRIMEAAAPAPAPTKPQAPPRPQTPRPKPKHKPWQIPKTNPTTVPAPKANQPATKPAPRPTAPPAPARPSKPKHKPWQIPKTNPTTVPAPKATKFESKKTTRRPIKEAWDDVSPDVKRFFSNVPGQKHFWGKHPLLAMYGNELAQSQYGEGEAKYKQHSGFKAFGRGSQGALNQAVMQIMQIEAQHKEAIEELAISLASQILNMPEDLFEARLGKPTRQEIEQEQGGDFEIDTTEALPKHLEADVHKRVTANMLTQGHALHVMDTAHFQEVALDKLRELDPRLPELYSKFSHGSRGLYYFTPIIEMLKDRQMRVQGAAGLTYLVEMDGDDQEALDAPEGMDAGDLPGESDPEGINASDLPGAESEPEVESRDLVVMGIGIVFPVLMQELIKGGMELISLNAIGHLSAQESAMVKQAADDPAEEAWHFLVGPQVWKYLLKIIPQGHHITEVLMNLYYKDADYVHRILADLIEAIKNKEPLDKIKEEIVELMRDIEEDTTEDFSSADYEAFEPESDEDYGSDDEYNPFDDGDDEF